MRQADVLSDVLRTVRLTGAAYFDLELSSPWVADTPAAREIADIVMPEAERVIEYHLVAAGSCWARVADHPSCRLNEGDLLILPQGDAHVLSSAPGLPATPDRSLWVRPSAALPIVYELGGGGPDRARLVCGFLGFDERPFNPLIAALPRVIHLPAAGPSERTPTASTLATLVHLAIAESRQSKPGSENVLARLSELMFVEAIRRHIEAMPMADSGWLAGLKDPVVGRALAALHGDARHPWTVETLAREGGVSRSVFAERFTALVGQPPMQYLSLWRMQVAARLLADGSHVGLAADAVGYESEAAFSRAFKKAVGEAPAAWRRRAETRAAGSLAR